MIGAWIIARKYIHDQGEQQAYVEQHALLTSDQQHVAIWVW